MYNFQGITCWKNGWNLLYAVWHLNNHSACRHPLDLKLALWPSKPEFWCRSFSYLSKRGFVWRRLVELRIATTVNNSSFPHLIEPSYGTAWIACPPGRGKSQRKEIRMTLHHWSNGWCWQDSFLVRGVRWRQPHCCWHFHTRKVIFVEEKKREKNHNFMRTLN